MSLAKCILYVLLVELAACKYEATERSLNGDRWTIKDSMGKLSEPIQAHVPGQIHLDLMHAGIIEDPYANWNDWLYQWIGYDNWTYFGTVDISSEEIGAEALWLKFDGLDTIATVSVNGKVVGRADNYHRRHKFEIKHAVVVGSNSIRVDFQSGANYSYEQAAAYPYDLYTDVQGVFFNKSQRGFIRKTQSDFGWDWGPGLAPCGIWGNISLIVPAKTPFSSVAVVSDVTPKTVYNPTKKSYSVSVTVCVDVVRVASGLTVKVSAEAVDLQGTLVGYFTVNSVGESCGTVVGMDKDEKTIEAGHLWWPLGVRWPQTKDKANLTEIKTSVIVLYELETIATATVTKKVGFRNIELVQNPVGPNGTDGLTFFFQLATSTQAYPFYAKGSNFIPMDAFVNRVTKERAQKLLTAFVDGNQNMLRVWGGGLYQPDWFYDLCDEMGIMVWQEFMFADALYPRDETFLVNVEAEIRDVVRRLGHHPSIVLWSGNNENQGILGNNTVRIVDYTVLYDEVIRTTLWEEDTSRLYWPSSPSNGVLFDDKSRKLFIQRWGDVANPNYGDVHRYDYNDFCLDVSKFPRPRFVSEFGFQSYPSSTSIKNVSKPVDWSNDSPFMVHRNHHPTGNNQMQDLIAMNFNLPVNDNSEDKFLDFIYLSQVMQGLCIRAQAEHYRRMISEEGVYTRGTLYWQLNDIWQAQTWSSVEWTGQWKVLHYYMRRAYAPILVSPYQMDDRLIVYVVLDVINHEISYTLEVAAISWATGRYLNDIRVPALKSSGFTGTLVFNETMDKVFNGTSPKEGCILLNLISDTATEILATNWHFPSNFTEVDLPDAMLKATDFKSKVMDGQYVITFTLSASAVAPFVYMESTKYYGVFSDNGFLMRPDFPLEITFTTSDHIDLDIFQRGLTVRSIKDTYSNKPYDQSGANTAHWEKKLHMKEI